MTRDGGLFALLCISCSVLHAVDRRFLSLCAPFPLEMLSRMPTAAMIMLTDVPPALKNGSGRPGRRQNARHDAHVDKRLQARSWT